MARRIGKKLANIHALEVQQNDSNPLAAMVGSGMTDNDSSDGESLRGGNRLGLTHLVGAGRSGGGDNSRASKLRKVGNGKASTKLNQAQKMGKEMSEQIHQLHGAGFWSDFGDSCSTPPSVFISRTRSYPI